LREEEANQLIEKAGIKHEGNPFSALKSSRFYKHSDRERALFGFFNVDVPDTGDGETPGLIDLTAKYGLFDYQHVVFDQAMSHYNRGDNRVFLHMPTGSGKTRISMSLVCNIIKKSDSGIVLWLAEGQELLEQAIDEFKTAWTHLGNQEVQVSRFYGNYSWDDIDQGFIAAGLQKLWNAHPDQS